MTIRYRKLTADGDYTFGQSAYNFHTGTEAVAQAAKTRFLLWRDTFWRDLSDGVPYLQEILGRGGGEQHIETITAILLKRLRGTPDVIAVPDFSTVYDRATREYKFTATIQTAYSTTVITGAL